MPDFDTKAAEESIVQWQNAYLLAPGTVHVAFTDTRHQICERDTERFVQHFGAVPPRQSCRCAPGKGHKVCKLQMRRCMQEKQRLSKMYIIFALDIKWLQARGCRRCAMT